ncbi:hypothetical protein GWI33_019169 [Rhynchophorus ferrugineus]|uniref:Uncharacterized protein n=1 Tax=Rhynchophorus ferrugineus TaxID=354439 RepID=A0A834HWM8_RHYFE|nr:hypothetical protein GWI33_019169 [Rhynchophorus ferrugineus]
MISSTYLLLCFVSVHGISSTEISTSSEYNNEVTETTTAVESTTVAFSDNLLSRDDYILNRIPEQPPGISVISPVLIKKREGDDLHRIVDSIYEFSYKRYIVN